MYPAPVVSFFSPPNAVLSSGGMLTVSGLSFDTKDQTPTIAVATGAFCQTASWSSATSVVCSILVGMATGAANDLSLTVASVVGSRTLSFSFDGHSLTP